jgi:SNF2 family DNA or RNA helicase
MVEDANVGAEAAEKPRLIISPNSVTGHWKDELKKWADADSVILSGSSKQKTEQLKDALNTPGVWIIVNWEAIRLIPELAKVDWLAVLADEAHRAKNRKAKQTKALWKLRAPVQLALTGTPIMSSPGDLWAILKWLRREQYTSYWAFLANYAETYSGFKGKQIVVGVKNADSLRFELSDKLVRRTKREIHADIPEPFPPIERVIAMKPKQAAVYQEALKDFWLEIVAEIPQMAEAEEMEEAKIREDLALAVDDPGGVERIKYMITNAAARLTRLRQVATSPALLGGEDESGKLDAVIETITDAEEGRPFVVFAWYKPTVQLIIDRLDSKGIEARGFTGDTKVTERHALAESFQSGDFQVIVPTLAVGGEGIDLYRSSDPLLAESDWTPAINKQGIDRCDRKGQTASVQGQYFYSEDTVDTGRLMPKQKLKTQIVETILGG